MVGRFGVEPLTAKSDCKSQADVRMFWDHNKDFRTCNGVWTTRRELWEYGHRGSFEIRYGKGGAKVMMLEVYRGGARV